MMVKYGISNVRGSSWCKLKLSPKQIRDLFLHISSKKEVKSEEFISQLKGNYGNIYKQDIK